MRNPSRSGAGMLLLAIALSFSAPARAGAATYDQTKLTASDAVADDRFGASVAVDGGTLVVGAPLDDAKGNKEAGAVYVFVRRGSGWMERAQLTAGQAASTDQSFGRSVAISGDLVAVGTNSEAIYVFERDGTSWSEGERLIADDSEVGDEFGRAVDIDGDLLVAGAGDDDLDGTAGGKGSAYVFVRARSTWVQEVKLTAEATDDARGDQFGRSVAIDGNTVVIGSPSDDDDGNQSGSAYVFVRSFVCSRQGCSFEWAREDKLTASDAGPGHAFGGSVAIDGDTLVVGANSHDTPGLATVNQGAAYVFEREGGVWSEEQILTADDIEESFLLGSTLAIEGDAIVVGAIGTFAGGDQANLWGGAAHLFAWDGSTWVEEARFTPTPVGPDYIFGSSVDISGDEVIVGSSGDDDAGAQAGAIYVLPEPSHPTLALFALATLARRARRRS